MKKSLAAAAVLVVLLVIAPWGVGKLAERHITQGLDRAMEQMPYMAIADRQYTRGWFSSEQVVTFELRTPWTRLLREVLAAKANGTQTEEAAQPGVAAPPHDQGPRITVRNAIQHGPVLWPFGAGAARVTTHIDWDDETRQTFVRVFGDEEPFEVVSRVGFFGGGTTTVSSEGRKLRPGEGGEVSWDDLELNVHYSRDASKFGFDGKWPRFEATAKDGTHFVMRDLTADGSATRIMGELYDSDGVFRIASIRVEEKGAGTIDLSAIEYEVETQPHEDFVDLSFRIGAGPVEAKQLTLEEAHYDFSLRRLHAASLDRLLATIKQSYAQTSDETAEVSIGLSEEERKSVFALFEHDPVFSIDRISLATKSGDGAIKGEFRFKGVTEEDLAMGGMGLIGKLDAVIDIDISVGLINDLGGDASTVEMATGQGYAELQGERVTSRIEFKAGALKINGKIQQIPGLGGPPPETAGPEADAWEGPEK